MKVYDISMLIHKDIQVYKNNEEKKPEIRVAQDFTTGSAYESEVKMNMHTGTHIDMPLHMIEGGNTLDTFDITKMITKCKVLDLTHVEKQITKDDLVQMNIEEDDFILLKTKNSYEDHFNFDFVFVEKSGAAYLKEKKIKGVGIDALGIERSQPNHETHIILLGAGIVILEGLRLKGIEPGEYFLYAPPLKIKGVEAAPTRAILIENKTITQ